MNKPLVIITGASSGIGAGLAKLFSQKGYNLALLARNKKAMEALTLPNALCIATDVTQPESVKQAILQAEKQFGPVDCLINNAGFAQGGDFTEIDHNTHQKTVEVNLLGVMNCIEIVLPGMRDRKVGTIINISSLSDRRIRPQTAIYAATKAAVKSLSDSLRAANAKYGLRICNLAPGKIDTPMLIRGTSKEDEIIPVEDMAKTVLWVYEQPQAICIQDLVIASTYYEL